LFELKIDEDAVVEFAGEFLQIASDSLEAAVCEHPDIWTQIVHR
jgi:hypothetical protein